MIPTPDITRVIESDNAKSLRIVPGTLRRLFVRGFAFGLFGRIERDGHERLLRRDHRASGGPRGSARARRRADDGRWHVACSRSACTMQTEILKVTGMTCGSCTSKVTRALQGITGVDDVKVALSSGEATVRFDERLTSPAKLSSAVEAAGYRVDAAGASADRQAKDGCCCH